MWREGVAHVMRALSSCFPADADILDCLLSDSDCVPSVPLYRRPLSHPAPYKTAPQRSL